MLLHITCRYIQGARFYGTEDTNSLSTIPVPVQQPASEVMIENETSLTATSSGATFRARFVGQGYKQVNNLPSHFSKIYIMTFTRYFILSIHVISR